MILSMSVTCKKSLFEAGVSGNLKLLREIFQRKNVKKHKIMVFFSLQFRIFALEKTMIDNHNSLRESVETR